LRWERGEGPSGRRGKWRGGGNLPEGKEKGVKRESLKKRENAIVTQKVPKNPKKKRSRKRGRVRCDQEGRNRIEAGKKRTREKNHICKERWGGDI